MARRQAILEAKKMPEQKTKEAKQLDKNKCKEERMDRLRYKEQSIRRDRNMDGQNKKVNGDDRRSYDREGGRTVITTSSI